MTERSFDRYKWLSLLFSPLLREVRLVAAQTEEDAQRFRALGAPHVEVVGNMKNDLPAASAPSGQTKAAWETLAWSSDFIFCAGSTHPGEEAAVVDAYLAARQRAPRLKLILAPRHAERCGDVAAHLASRGIPFCLWSAPKPGADVLLIDQMGLLGSLYALSTVAFVGGTLIPVGGHNLLEPALASVPVLFGPHTSHQAESARLLDSAGAGFCVQDAAQLAALLGDLLSGPARCRAVGALARKTAERLRGATARTEKLLASLLDAAPTRAS